MHDSLVRKHDCTVEAAASAVIARRSAGWNASANAVVVASPDGDFAVALISTITASHRSGRAAR